MATIEAHLVKETFHCHDPKTVTEIDALFAIQTIKDAAVRSLGAPKQLLQLEQAVSPSAVQDS